MFILGRDRVVAVLIASISITLWNPTSTAAQDEDGAFEVEDIVVIGSRRPVRSASDTPAPVDLVTGEDFTDQGVSDMSTLLRNLVPSYNVGTQPISDAATFVRPANLRGLAPDQTLVFVNGKRRHRAAVISWLGNGVSEGSQGPDISVIPAIALKRVEVLRDAASAQYGSDAIAGVLNFVLKDRPDGGIIETQWGQTSAGDGEEYRLATNVGLPISETGFINLSAEWSESDPTVRSVQRGDAQGLIEGGNPHVRQPYAQIWGQPTVWDDYTLFVNSGIELNPTTEFYGFANHASRTTEGGFFFRNPNTRSGVYSSGGYRLVFDIDETDATTCPNKEIRVEDPSEYFDVAAFKQAYPGCFVFNELYPGGFTPQFKGQMTDTAGTGGLRGTLPSGLTYDVSYTFGRNEIEFSMRDTVNASLGPNTPTQFELGSYTQSEETANLDFTKSLDVGALASQLHVAAGAEVREEQFEISAGQTESWIAGPGADDGFGVGSNGFSGFNAETVAGKWTQSNVAGYVDLEADLTEDLTLQAMGRVEHFDDFDTTTDAKVGALFRLTPEVGFRGSASTGFRVPTVGQQNTLNVTTAFLENETTGRLELTQDGTIPVRCAEARVNGARPLQPEESVTYTAGVVATLGPVSLTADYYNIDIDGRLGLSSNFTLSAEQKAEIGDSGCLPNADVLTFGYFGNGFNTTTSGVDIVAAVDISGSVMFLDSGQTEVVFVGNWNKTEVKDDYDRAFLDEKRILQLEDALPKERFNATLRHQQGPWNGLLRLNYFGSYKETHVDALSLLIEAGSEVTMDVELGYDVQSNIELTVGVQNLLDNFPDENPYATTVGAKYPESSPMGFAGRFYYARARYLF